MSRCFILLRYRRDSNSNIFMTVPSPPYYSRLVYERDGTVINIFEFESVCRYVHERVPYIHKSNFKYIKITIYLIKFNIKKLSIMVMLYSENIA